MLFPQEQLVQFVFANERADILWNGIFRTDLHRYLFYQLYGDGYPLVYFIDCQGGKLSVVSYPRTNAKSCWTKPLFGSQESKLAKWISKQLTKNQERCAVVVHLDTFCHLFEQEKSVLEEIAQKHEKGECFGTIVLVGSHNADKNQPYLMESPVFEYLHEDAVMQVRSAKKIDNVYSVLKTYRQRQNCFFFNRYIRESITDLVNGVAIQSSRCYPGTEMVHLIANYLTKYLNCPDMQMKEKRIFDSKFPYLCPSYQEIDQQLRKEAVWTSLCRQSAAYDKAYPSALKDDTVDAACQSAHFIYHDNSVQMKCMKLCEPGALYDGLYDDRTAETLHQIYHLVRLCGNKPMNPQIADKADDFILMFSSARQKADKNTCFRIAAGILLCVKWMTVESDQEILVLEIIRMTEECVRASAKLFNLQKLKTGLITEQQQQTLDELTTYLEHFDATFSSLSMDVELSADVMENMQTVMQQLPVITTHNYAGMITDEENIVQQVKTRNYSSFGAVNRINIYDDDD